MDKPKMIQAMMASISEVLEQMFFLPIDVVEGRNAGNARTVDAHPSIAASIDFDGPSSGVFVLHIPSALAASITADFLGTASDELTEDQITGTVKEMLNMLAGNSLSAYDAQASFNLKIPELITLPAAATEKEDIIDIGIETMDSRMTLHMAN